MTTEEKARKIIDLALEYFDGYYNHPSITGPLIEQATAIIKEGDALSE